MPYVLKDSENPRMKGHRVSNGFNEHLFKFHSLALESKKKDPEHRSALCLCQLLPIREGSRGSPHPLSPWGWVAAWQGGQVWSAMPPCSWNIPVGFTVFYRL